MGSDSPGFQVGQFVAIKDLSFKGTIYRVIEVIDKRAEGKLDIGGSARWHIRVEEVFSFNEITRKTKRKKRHLVSRGRVTKVSMMHLLHEINRLHEFMRYFNEVQSTDPDIGIGPPDERVEAYRYRI